MTQERIVLAKHGLVRITLKCPFANGTVAVDMDPLSLLSRLAAAVPYPRFHTVRYSGVLASASKLRARIAPKPAQTDTTEEEATQCVQHAEETPRRGPYRPWAELLKRTFKVDVLQCPKCQGRMRLLAVLNVGNELTRYLAHLGEPTELPTQEPARGPPYWKSLAPRRRLLGDEAA